jgi:hypothetical protein
MICIYFRLDLQHYALQQVTGKRFFAPLTEPQRAIDIGAGSGTWLLASIYTLLTSCQSLTNALVGNGSRLSRMRIPWY